MVLVRIAYAADLPTPDEVVRDHSAERRPAAPAPANGGGRRASERSRRASMRRAAHRAPRSRPRSLSTAQVPDISRDARRAGRGPRRSAIANFPALIALASEKRDS